MIDHFELYMLIVASNKHNNFPYVLLVGYVTEQVSFTTELVGISIWLFWLFKSAHVNTRQ